MARYSVLLLLLFCDVTDSLNAFRSRVYRNSLCVVLQGSRLRSRHEQIYVGDVVVLRDPFDPNNYLVRRLAALSGHEMVSTNEEDEPFVVEDGQCWVLSDNQNLKPEESKDSRTYGPFSITNILGRVMYRFQSYEDNGVVVNSELSMLRDMPLLYAESSEISLSLEKDEESKGPQT